MKRILFVGNYPNVLNENLYVFFKNLIHAMADIGVECYVISPVSITKYMRKIKSIPLSCTETTKKGSKIKVFYPRFISTSSKKIGPFNTIHITHHNYMRAVLKMVKKINIDFDAAYGHFFISGGLSAVYVGEKMGIPSFVAYGES